MYITDENSPVPLFRPDLEFYLGPEKEGAPTYTLFDPISENYFLVPWEEWQVIQNIKQNMTYRQLKESIEKNSTINITIDDLIQFLEEAGNQNLLQCPVCSELLLGKVEQEKKSLFSTILDKYLFFNLPLFQTDIFFARTLKYVKFLASPPAFVLYATLSLWGLTKIAIHWNEYIGTFALLINFKGALTLVASITFVKILHEFGHAYTAKYYGLPVRRFGIAFVAFWPGVYCDVSHMWKLHERSKRLRILSAGILVESVIAGLSAFAWSITGQGTWHTVFFVLSSLSVISTFIVNFNVLMRFDGYYMLSEWLAIDDLQERSFDILYSLMSKSLGLPSEPIELELPKTLAFATYALAVIVYRIVLYCVIIYFFYQLFPKVIALPLIVITVMRFIFIHFWNLIKKPGGR